MLSKLRNLKVLSTILIAVTLLLTAWFEVRYHFKSTSRGLEIENILTIAVITCFLSIPYMIFHNALSRRKTYQEEVVFGGLIISVAFALYVYSKTFLVSGRVDGIFLLVFFFVCIAQVIFSGLVLLIAKLTKSKSKEV